MTSATTPSGSVTSSTPVSGYDGYKAFDRNYSTYFASTASDQWVMYEFPAAVCVRGFSIYSRNDGTFNLLGLNNTSDAGTQIGSIVIGSGGDGTTATEVWASNVNNSTKYKYYKLVKQSGGNIGIHNMYLVGTE